MTQNTYTPSDLSLYTQVETEAGSLTGPFNPDRVAELVNTAMVPFGGIPPVGYLGCGEFDTLINVALPNPVTQQQIDDCMTALLAICNDPTRNDPTQEEADTAAIQAHLDALVGLSAVDKAYALMGRMFAVRDGASQNAINAIVNRATAVAYVTGKASWTALPAASKTWEAQSLEMLALVFQVVLLGITNSDD